MGVIDCIQKIDIQKRGSHMTTSFSRSLQLTKKNMFLNMIISYSWFVLSRLSGPGGNRTRVRKPLPRSISHHSCLFTFPQPGGRQQPQGFSSFIIRLRAQSFARIVSRNHDAGDREYGYNRADEQHLGRYCNCIVVSVYFFVRFLRGPGHGWLPRLQNPRRNQYKPLTGTDERTHH